MDCGARPRGIGVPHRLRGGVGSSEGGTRQVAPRPARPPLSTAGPRLITGTGSSPREANTWSLLGNACACPQVTPLPNEARGYLSSASSATPSCRSVRKARGHSEPSGAGPCAARGDVYPRPLHVGSLDSLQSRDGFPPARPGASSVSASAGDVRGPDCPLWELAVTAALASTRLPRHSRGHVTPGPMAKSVTGIRSVLSNENQRQLPAARSSHGHLSPLTPLYYEDEFRDFDYDISRKEPGPHRAIALGSSILAYASWTAFDLKARKDVPSRVPRWP